MLKQLKEKFTEYTGMPARKAFVEVACAKTDRRMVTIGDWQWAINNINPEFDRRNRQKAEPQPEVAETVETVEGAIANFCFAAPLELVEVLLEKALEISLSPKLFYKALARRFHPDANPSKRATELFQILTRIYERYHVPTARIGSSPSDREEYLNDLDSVFGIKVERT